MGWGMLAGLGQGLQKAGDSLTKVADNNVNNAMAAYKEEATKLMEERLHERNKTERATEKAEDRAFTVAQTEKTQAFTAEQNAKNLASQERRDKSGHSNAELQVYSAWKEGELAKGKKPEEVTISKYWEDKNHRSGSDSAIIAQAVKMSTNTLGEVDEEKFQQNYSLLMKTVKPSSGGKQSIDDLFPKKDKPQAGGASGAF